MSSSDVIVISRTDEPFESNANEMSESITIHSTHSDDAPTSSSIQLLLNSAPIADDQCRPSSSIGDHSLTDESIILDLSNRSLSTIPPLSVDDRDRYKRVQKLILSNNVFNVIHGLASFSSVIEVCWL